VALNAQNAGSGAKLREADRYVDDWGNPVEPWDEPDP
jgi:hypothetical protein